MKILALALLSLAACSGASSAGPIAAEPPPSDDAGNAPSDDANDAGALLADASAPLDAPPIDSAIDSAAPMPSRDAGIDSAAEVLACATACANWNGGQACGITLMEGCTCPATCPNPLDVCGGSHYPNVCGHECVDVAAWKCAQANIVHQGTPLPTAHGYPNCPSQVYLPLPPSEQAQCVNIPLPILDDAGDATSFGNLWCCP